MGGYKLSVKIPGSLGIPLENLCFRDSQSKGSSKVLLFGLVEMKANFTVDKILIGVIHYSGHYFSSVNIFQVSLGYSLSGANVLNRNAFT